MQVKLMLISKFSSWSIIAYLPLLVLFISPIFFFYNNIIIDLSINYYRSTKCMHSSLLNMNRAIHTRQQFHRILIIAKDLYYSTSKLARHLERVMIYANMCLPRVNVLKRWLRETQFAGYRFKSTAGCRYELTNPGYREFNPGRRAPLSPNQ